MRPIFTIHAGEFIFGDEVSKRFPALDLWIPAKDRGIDFLISDECRQKTTAVQVKMSRDYRPHEAKTDFESIRAAGGWLTFPHKKLATSPADIWSIVLVSHERKSRPHFINIPPTVLLERLTKIHEEPKENYHLYPWVLGPSSDRICVEGRGLKKRERQLLADSKLELGARDLTEFFDNWDFLERK